MKLFFVALVVVLALSANVFASEEKDETIAGVAQAWGKALLSKMDPMRAQRDKQNKKSPKKWDGSASAGGAKKGGMRESIRKWMGRDKEVREANRGKQAMKGVPKRGRGKKAAEGRGEGEGAHARWGQQGQQGKPKPKPKPQPSDDAGRDSGDDAKPKPKPKVRPLP